jgi:hypothetical protein
MRGLPRRPQSFKEQDALIPDMGQQWIVVHFAKYGVAFGFACVCYGAERINIIFIFCNINLIVNITADTRRLVKEARPVL